MPDQAPFRHVHLHRSRLLVEPRPSGDQLLRVEQPLFDHPQRLSDRLLEHAAAAPERGFLAQRTASGEFRVISYACALAHARKLGAALLARRLCAERPLAIISENDLEHGLLALAALYVGVPFVAISPAYSLLSRDYKKLQYALKLMTPGSSACTHTLRSATWTSFSSADLACATTQPWHSVSARASEMSVRACAWEHRLPRNTWPGFCSSCRSRLRRRP